MVRNEFKNVQVTFLHYISKHHSINKEPIFCKFTFQHQTIYLYCIWKIKTAQVPKFVHENQNTYLFFILIN